MGLEGYLEDLGISEILQIVSLSKKSGTLSLQNANESGTITFLGGQVVRATSSCHPETLGQLLVAAEITTAQQIDSVLEQQKKLAEHKPLGMLLKAQYQIQPEVIEEVVRRQIEKIVFSFFSWSKGTFSFQLNDPESFGTAAINPLDFMLEKGISSEHLLVKGTNVSEQSCLDTSVDDEALETKIRDLQQRLDDNDLNLLRGMLAELENPYLSGGIIMLILRYASEIMKRAIIFDVRGRLLVGLGQFGLNAVSSEADQIIRTLNLEIESGSLFYQALTDQVSICAPLGNSHSEKTLTATLGGGAEKVFLGPLVSDGKVVAMLYGDNYPEGTPLHSVKAFDLFLSQAGLYMEQALNAE